MEETAQPAKKGLSGVDIAGYVAILLGAAAIVFAANIWTNQLIGPAHVTFAARLLGFGGLTAAYGFGLVQRKKMVLGWGWCLLPILGLGLSPLGIIGAILVLWLTTSLRKQPQTFAA